MRTSPVILLEFNELTPALLDRFIGDGHLPHFRQLRDQSSVFITDAEEDRALEPWIQWVTVHSGLRPAEHRVGRLDQGHTLEAPRLWDLLSRRGYSSWVCGSMNVRYEDSTRALVLPDPWCTRIRPRPAELEPYFTFVQANVQEHTSGRVSLSPAGQVRFLAWMARHGLAPATVVGALRQVIAERLHDARWKRVAFLDRLQFDVFAYYYRKVRPDFSTFFLNSTAHYQHAYWDSMEPDKYQHAVPERKRAKFGDAILFGYQRMDAILGQLFRLAGDDATVILCTALSQQPSNNLRVRYRPRNFEAFLSFVGVQSPTGVAPVMADQFYVDFGSLPEAERAAERLEQVTAGDVQIVRVKREGLRLFCACKVPPQISADAVVRAGDASGSFTDLLYRVPTSKIADHHPHGVLWVRVPGRTPRTAPEVVPLTGVAPTILQMFGVMPPAHMRGPTLVSA